MSTQNCSICGAVYIGGHCPNCGWYTALKNVKSPALALGTPLGGARRNPIPCRKETPVQMSVPGVRVRPHLSVVGSENPTKGIELHHVDFEQLAANINAIRTQTIPEDGVATAFLRMLAHMWETGRLAGLAEAGVA